MAFIPSVHAALNEMKKLPPYLILASNNHLPDRFSPSAEGSSWPYPSTVLDGVLVPLTRHPTRLRLAPFSLAYYSSWPVFLPFPYQHGKQQQEILIFVRGFIRSSPNVADLDLRSSEPDDLVDTSPRSGYHACHSSLRALPHGSGRLG